MWDNPRLLNLIAGALVGVAALAFGTAALAMLLRSELFPVREIVVVSPLKNTSREEIAAAVRIEGNFFAVSSSELRAQLEKLPWVRSASVRRVWPDRFEVAIEEHVALARWGDDALVDTLGEKFFARTSEALPLFAGPPGSERELARRYASFSAILAPLGAPIERVVLSPRLAWQLRLQDGLSIVLGRDADAAQARLRRFVDAYDATLKPLIRRHEYVDLRYPNGFALRIREAKS
ncbi:MAG: cell division protein FtsQ/DivIB [Betaproteobacteria bacterium]|nr:cell division protein FtsQ/DivIB [Betaproteobacteria bacterium]